MTTPLHIHFVCTGNLYRSRLSEAYLKSLNVPGITVSSSGTQASEQTIPISWYTEYLLEKDHLMSFASKQRTQTTQAQLTHADIVICIGQNNYEYCQQFVLPDKHEVWDIPDFDPKEKNDNLTEAEQKEVHKQLAEQTFLLIKQHVNRLISLYKEL